MTSVHSDGMTHDEHDLGLLHDLATMRQRWLHPSVDRRGALRLLGAAGAGLVLAACGGDKKSASGSTTTTAASGSSQGTTLTTAATGTTAATSERVPSETAGPFPADGTNGPNVLTESGVVKSDITTSFGKFSGTAVGVPMTIKLKLNKPGAAVYLWHCDAEGLYSLYSEGATAQNYLRGVQAADGSGNLTFQSVVPAAYPGRWPHLHYEVFSSLSEATKAGGRLVTSQIALPEDACNAVYDADSRYGQSKSHMQRTSLESDGVFRDGYERELATMSGSPSAGYTLDFTVTV